MNESKKLLAMGLWLYSFSIFLSLMLNNIRLSGLLMMSIASLVTIIPVFIPFSKEYDSLFLRNAKYVLPLYFLVAGIALISYAAYNDEIDEYMLILIIVLSSVAAVIGSILNSVSYRNSSAGRIIWSVVHMIFLILYQTSFAFIVISGALLGGIL